MLSIMRVTRASQFQNPFQDGGLNQLDRADSFRISTRIDMVSRLLLIGIHHLVDHIRIYERAIRGHANYGRKPKFVRRICVPLKHVLLAATKHQYTCSRCETCYRVVPLKLAGHYNDLSYTLAQGAPMDHPFQYRKTTQILEDFTG